MKIFGIVIILLQLIVIGMLSFPSEDQAHDSDEQYKMLAVKLETEELYQFAVKEYEKYAECNISDSRKANVYHKIADIYFEHILDYSQALAAYYKALSYTNRTDIKEEIDRKIVQCLDNLGKGREARQKLESTTLLDPKHHEKTHLVAQIGSRKIFLSEIEEEIKTLPEHMQKEYSAPEKKLEFVRQYVQTELLYEKGLRQNYDTASDVLDSLQRAKKNIITQKVYNDLISAKMPPLTMDAVKEYYEKHKEEFKKDGNIPTFEECQQQIAQTIQFEQLQKTSSEFMKQLFSENNIKIYDDMFRSKK